MTPTPDNQTPLAQKMRALADGGHERAGELRDKADTFDAAAIGYYSDPPTVTAKSFLGAFARARRLWSDVSGEPLV